MTERTKQVEIDVKEIFDEAFKLFADRNAYWDSRFIDKGFDACLSNLEDKVYDIKQGGKPPKEDRYECCLDVAIYAILAAYLEMKAGNVDRPIFKMSK
jgi:hypothetical protein